MTVVEHLWNMAARDGDPPDADRLTHARTLARRNQHPQMVHTHPPNTDCGADCVGVLPGPPEASYAARIIGAATAVITATRKAPQ